MAAKRLRVGIVWKNDYPWDVRVEKIARTLADAGHETFILCANAKARPPAETVDGIHIRRLPATGGARVDRLISTPFYFNPFWYRLARRVVADERLDLVIVRDLPLIFIGLHLKRRYRVPIMLDMAENYPAMYREDMRGSAGLRYLAQWLLKNPTLMEHVERRTLRDVDHILVVVQESAQRVIGLGVPAERVSVVSNTPRTDGAASPAHAGAQPPVRSYLQLVYAGFVQEGRGLETAVRALPLAHARGVDVRLRVVGDGTYMNQLKALVRELRLERAVEFTGWVSPADVTRHIEQADIGVIPHPKHAHTDTTIPNKLFDYMAGAKPVIVSNAAPMERIVRAEACGLVFVAGDAESFAEQLACLSADAAGRRTMGQNGARAVRERFNWQRDAAVLRGAVAAVVRAS